MAKQARPAVLLAMMAMGAVLAMVSGTGCVTEDTVQSSETDFGSARPTEPRTPTDSDPMPVIATVMRFVTGDTLILAGGRTVKLAGIKAPSRGENCAETARAALQRIIGQQLIRMTFVTGTKYTDPVWHVNVLIPNPKDVEFPSGAVLPRGQGAISANLVMLSQGLARPDGIDKLEFSRVIDAGDKKGQLESLTDRQNKAIRAEFHSAATHARTHELYLYSRDTHP